MIFYAASVTKSAFVTKCDEFKKRFRHTQTRVIKERSLYVTNVIHDLRSSPTRKTQIDLKVWRSISSQADFVTSQRWRGLTRDHFVTGRSISSHGVLAS